eukprot:5066514-Amphidinium_carterae.1
MDGQVLLVKCALQGVSGERLDHRIAHYTQSTLRNAEGHKLLQSELFLQAYPEIDKLHLKCLKT